MLKRELTDREKLILREVIAGFIVSAQPIGSRTLSKRLKGKFSPATIRNVMSDLEEMGLLDQPHTSAGRIPTELGYRLFVDGLMQHSHPTAREKELLHQQLIRLSSADVSSVLEQTAHLLADISNLLCVVMSPQVREGVLHRIDLISTGGDSLLVVATIESGFVRSLFLEVKSAINREEIEWITAFLNQRLAGLSLTEIRSSMAARLRGSGVEETPILRTVMQHADRLFNFSERDDVLIGGVRTLASQPEFYNVAELRKMLTLLEDKQLFLHLFARYDEGLKVHIGRENAVTSLSSFSVVTAPYKFKNLSGAIGLVGPLRMNYSKAVSIVEYTTRQIGALETP